MKDSLRARRKQQLLPETVLYAEQLPIGKQLMTAGRIFWIVILFFVLPVAVYFGLCLLKSHFEGDVLHAALYTVSSIAFEVLDYFLRYIVVGIVLYFTVMYGARRSAGVIVCGFVSLLMPYLCTGAANFMTVSGMADYMGLYLAYSLLNYAVAAVILAAGVILASLLRRRPHRKPVYLLVFAIAAGIFFLIDLGTELYYTISFLYELKYQYYDVMTSSERLSIIGAYGLILLRGAAGFLSMWLGAWIMKEGDGHAPSPHKVREGD